MKKASYKERDYAFGQRMLRLRTTMSLTQAGLAELLGVSRHAVGEWEAGLSYPKAERLTHLIRLGVRASAFAVGHEEEEIRALWKAARQKVQLDEAWLHDLLAAPEPIQRFPPVETQAPRSEKDPSVFPRIDWIGALDVSYFAGREVEAAELTQWIVHEHCRVVMLLGMGGIGKSVLASFLGQRLAPQFEAVLWRSVRDAPVCEDLVADCITFFSQMPPTALPPSLEQRINQLLACLQAHRCMLVLDNLETLFESGDQAGNYLPGYEGYGRLLQRLAESSHQSCVLLTSREKPKEIEPLEGIRTPVRSFRLAGVDQQAAQALLLDKGLRGTSGAWQQFVASYAGNPLALKIVAQVIADLFDGDIDRFLHEGSVIFNGIRSVLRQQMERLTPLEHLLLTWFAVLREWTSLETLHQILSPRVPRMQILEALEALGRRSLLERGQQASFSLQSVVMEYLTDALVEQLSQEIVQGEPQQIRRYTLEQGQAKDYIRQTQVRLLVHPLIEQLRSELGADAQIEAHLLRLLSQFRAEDAAAQGYGPANVISMLKALRGHLRDLDLSRLALRNVSLQGIEMQDTRLSEATLRDCVFTETINAIMTVAVSKDGQYWATASISGEVWVWGEAGRTLHRVWQAHSTVVGSLAFSPNGHILASGSWDNTVKLWDVASGSLLWSGWQTGSVNAVAFAPDGSLLASGGGNTLVQLWEPQSGTNVQTLAGQGGTVCSLAWSPDGRLLASGCVDGSIWMWAPKLREPHTSVQVLAGHINWVTGLAFSPDGTQMASVSYDGTVKVWDIPNPGSFQTFSGHTDRVIRVAWSPDGRTLASCGHDKTIWLWNVKEGRARTVLYEHSAAVYTLAFTPDSRRLVSGSEDSTVRVWDVESGECLSTISGYVPSLLDIDWSPNGMQLVSGGTDTFVTLWDATGTTPPRVLPGHRGNVPAVAWSSDEHLIASAGNDNSIRLWDTTTGIRLQMLQAPDAVETTFLSIAWSPDGSLLACGTYLRGMQVWDMTTYTRRWIVETQSPFIRSVSWSSDGTRVVSGGDNGSIYVWDARDGLLLQQLAEHHGAVMSVAWSPDGRRLASASGGQEGGELFVWMVHSGQRVQVFPGHPGLVYAVAWSPSGEILISGGSDGRVRWWEVESGVCIRVQEAHQGTVHALKVSPDGSRFATCGYDGVVQIWDLHSGELLRTLRRNRPYERLNITGIKGLSTAQKSSLHALGAFGETSIDG